ncbi:Dynein heavy chain 9, axonemal [Hondaea fermentalgiana]|uniref:Dynein heavy chain 9, axonemal n=1 Tax=Hondaea fermentalgiana TaxID=2315210 RepID=A0A2R5G0U4_9STRA|nr:Dynein heavy chain 9, axonemal [Hondaea fermentalgiana]|eukprot:GBG24145.1 Dynein heavy chain 9, axonemal [Hondaea fermentalgiana]
MEADREPNGGAQEPRWGKNNATTTSTTSSSNKNSNNNEEDEEEEEEEETIEGVAFMYGHEDGLETARTSSSEDAHEAKDDQSEEDDAAAAANMLTWRKGFVVGDKRPTKRSGHTFTVLGSNAFLFGGCDAQSPAGPTGELWQLKMLGNFEWIRLDEQVDKAGGLPVARWLHSACVFDKKFIIVFGGFHSSKRRLNDLWMFDTITLQWSCLFPGTSTAIEDSAANGTDEGKTLCVASKNPASDFAPPPRGGHSASIVEDKMWVFGGYGGQGYARRDHNDLFMLNLPDMTWERAPPLKGTPPRPRSGHTASVIDTSIYIFGGWSAMEQLGDLCILDTRHLTWSILDSFMDPRWGHTACSVEAIPYWKIFYFGGCTGNLAETRRAQGALSARVLTLDTGTCVFDRPKVRGDIPCGRADTTFGYDAKGSRLVMFGGWANQWLDDIFTLDVGCVVGPPYSILGVFPRQGPLTGGTELTISGLDFVHDPNDPRIKVRFIAKGGYILDAPGNFVNGETITCISPDFDSLLQGDVHAAQFEVDVRVAFRDDSFTVTSQKFTFITVTVAEACLAYGPGLIDGGCPGVPTMFVVHANDVTGSQRATGGDEFVVRVSGDEVAVLDATIEDNEDGSYAVEYTAPLAGEYVIEVEYTGTFRDDTGQVYETGKAGPIRGSPFTVNFIEGAARASNKMNGPLLRETVDRKFQATKKLISATRVQLQKAISPGYAVELAADIKAVIAVKEKLYLVETERAVLELDLDLFECIARHLAESYGVKSDKRLREIVAMREEWATITEGQPNLLVQATAALRPHVIAHGDKTQAQLLEYEETVLAYERSIKHLPCFSWNAGPEGGMNALAEAVEAHEARLVTHAEMQKLAKLFEFPALCHGANTAMNRVERTLEHAQDLWEVAADALIFMDESKATLWRNVRPTLLEEEARKRAKTVSLLPRDVHDTDAFRGLERDVKNFLLTCPLISHLGSEAMRVRHWDELRAAIGKSFTSPAENKKMRLGEVVDLNLHEVADQVEDVANKAAKEAKVENALTRIERMWSTSQFQEDDERFEAADAPPYLSLPEEELASLDADQAAVDAMANSPHALPFMDPYATAEGVKGKGVKYWKNILASVVKIVNSLASIQSSWAYLATLFLQSDEVKEALPSDAKRFAALDEDVRKLLEDAKSNKLLLSFCAKPGRADNMDEVNEQLALCKTSLGNFIASKRASFPRFYFAAESQVLDILSNGSKPTEVLKHLSAVFPAISTLQTEGVYASHWLSLDKQECGAFDTPVVLKGQVETYLRDVDVACQQALKTSLSKSLTRYKTQQRRDWIVHKNEKGFAPEVLQIALLVCRISVTQDIEAAFAAIKSGNRDAMRDYSAKSRQQLADMAKAARQTTLTLAPSDLIRIACVLALDVHTRDLVDSFVQRQISSSASFDWQRQLKQRQTGATEMCGANFTYGFEYVGHFTRISPTPAFDQALLVTAQALRLQMGCVVRGPAVSGKTEVIRELGATLGRYCLIFNCTPQTTLHTLASLFAGLAATGSWLCLEEFDRLPQNVLAACVGRVKRLFDARSRGQTSATSLSAKICNLFASCHEVLPERPFYDWSLRALRALVTRAGHMRREWTLDPTTQEDETSLLLRALLNLLQPIIAPGDVQIFNGLVIDFFPLPTSTPTDLQAPSSEDANNQEGEEYETSKDDVQTRAKKAQRVDTGSETELEIAVKEASAARELWPDQDFLSTVVNLEELLKVRQAVFLVGEAGAGKSECWRTLQRSRQLLKRKTSTKVLLPQAHSADFFFGRLSHSNGDWEDGLLCKATRDCATAPTPEDGGPEENWIVLDGELSSIWFDSLNTLLDDNKTLSLASGERVSLPWHTRVLFELSTLEHMSPSAVSRAAIIHLSSAAGSQWRALIASWIQRKEWDDHAKEAITTFFHDYVALALAEFDKRTFRPLVPVLHTEIITTLLKMLDAVIGADEERLVGTAENLKDATQALEPAFVYCMVWALGAPLTEDAGADQRRELSGWWKTTFKNVKFPARDTVFDYYLDTATGKFELWKNSPQFTAAAAAAAADPINGQNGPDASSLHGIFVPTPETSSAMFWLERMIALEYGFLLIGGAGSGKTRLVRTALRDLNPNEQVSASIALQYNSSAASLHQALIVHLEKKNALVWGPPGDDKQLAVFLDDLHLPQRTTARGEHQVHASLRQVLEMGQAYDGASLGTKQIQNCHYVGSATCRKGQRPLSKRLQRHFVTFGVAFPGTSSLQAIFGPILQSHLRHFEDGVKALGNTLVEAVAGLHMDIMVKLRPSAAAPHYDFNLRHITRVFQGLLTAQPADFNDATTFVKLWCHESERVYADGLVSSIDLIKFRDLLLGQARRKFPTANMTKHCGDDPSDPLIVCHFAPQDGQVDDDPVYRFVNAYEDLVPALNAALDDLNTFKLPLDLVFFDEAISHVCRIARVLHASRGHCLLVGAGGCGKSSLAWVAAQVSNLSLSLLPVRDASSAQELKEELRNLCTAVGVGGERRCVLVRDRDVRQGGLGLLAYASDLAMTGARLAELFSEEERESIAQSVAINAKAAGYKPDVAGSFAYFTEKVQKDLHWIFSFDPKACDLQSWLRAFPALAQGTVVNWFHPWPEKALRSVAVMLLEDLELESDEIRRGAETFMVSAYTSSQKLAQSFATSADITTVHPLRAFVDCQRAFCKDLYSRRAANRQKKSRLENVAERMHEADRLVNSLEEAIQAQEEDAEEKTMLAEAQAEEVARDAAVVAEESKLVVVEQAKVDEIAAEAQAIKDDAQAEFDKAEPLLKKALDALDLLTKKDLGECKAMGSPPKGVDDVFCAVLILLAGVDPRIKLNKYGKPEDLSWDACKKDLMGNINEFLNQLKYFREAVEDFRVPKVNWANVRPILQLDHFQPETVERKNKAAGALASWVENIVVYYDTILCVEPKRQLLQEVEGRLAKATSVLDRVKAKVGELEIRLAKLREDLAEAETLRDEAVQLLQLSQLKLGLAQRLTTALSSETDRWAATIDELDKEFEVLLGDALLRSVFLAYAGPFDASCRKLLATKEWLPFLTKAAAGEAIPVSENLLPASIVSSRHERTSWQVEGLPADPTSSENAALLMACNSKRWPLVLDPHLHALAWLRTMCSHHSESWVTLHIDSPELVSKLGVAIAAGHTVVLEGIEPSLTNCTDMMSLMLRQAIKRGARDIVTIGNAEVELHEKFRLILHTSCSRARFPADLLTACSLINFSASQDGLEDELLELVARKEHPDLSSQIDQLTNLQRRLVVQREDLEDAILVSLADAEGDVCADEPLIGELEKSKTRLDSIANLAAATTDNTKLLKDFISKYRPVARRSALLFGIMSQMHKLHPSYTYSLNVFASMLVRGIALVTKPPPTSDEASGMAERLRAKVRNVVITERFAWDKSTLRDEALNALEGSDASSDVSSGALVGAQETVESISAISDAEIEERCSVLNRSITNMVFTFLRIGLLDRHALTVASHLCFQVLHEEGELENGEVDALVTCRPAASTGSMGPLSTWMPADVWARIKGLESVDGLQSIGDDIMSDSDDWKEWYLSSAPEEKRIPGELGELSEHKRLLIILAIRPDRLCEKLGGFVSSNMGPLFVDRQAAFDMDGVMQVTSASTPIIVLSSRAVDAVALVEALALRSERGLEQRPPSMRPATPAKPKARKGDQDEADGGDGSEAATSRLVTIFLGGGKIAFDAVEESILACAEAGHWIMLRDVHLAKDWLPRLENVLRAAATAAHDEFRCFMSAPAESFHRDVPQVLSQSAVKVAWDAGPDFRTNLEVAWASFPQSRIDACTSNRFEFQQTLFALSVFHSLMLGRRKFGHLGWSNSWVFLDSDVQLAADAAERYVAASEVQPGSIAWRELRCIVADLLYGGRIDESRDLEIVRAQLAALWQAKLVREDKKAFELTPGFAAPEAGLSHKQVQTMLRKKFPKDCPEMYGVKSFVDSKFWVMRQKSLCAGLALLASGAKIEQVPAPDDRAGKLRGIVKSLLERLPSSFNLEEAEALAKPALEDPKAANAPLVMVALQEAKLMNDLLERVRMTLDELQKALDGLQDMRPPLIEAGDMLLAQRVPGVTTDQNRTELSHTGSGGDVVGAGTAASGQLEVTNCSEDGERFSWAEISWPSTKPLDGWFDDLVQHADQLRHWMQDFTMPKSFWLPGFLRPLGLLSAVRQLAARRDNVAVETLTFATEVTMHRDTSTIDGPPDCGGAGIFLHGLSMEGARYYLGDTVDDALEEEEFFDDEDGDRRIEDEMDEDDDEEEDEGNLNNEGSSGNGNGPRKGHRYTVGKTRCGGFIVQSGLRNSVFPMPVILLRTVPIEPIWELAPGGFLRSEDDSIYSCPVYATSIRSDSENDASNGLLFLATLRTRVPCQQWVLANLSLVLRPG